MSDYQEKLQDPRWLKKREEILKRDGHRCCLCGSNRDYMLNVHHLKYQGEPWEAPDEYLETLCTKCHEWRHTTCEAVFVEFSKRIPSRTLLNFLKAAKAWSNETEMDLADFLHYSIRLNFNHQAERQHEQQAHT